MKKHHDDNSGGKFLKRLKENDLFLKARKMLNLKRRR